MYKANFQFVTYSKPNRKLLKKKKLSQNKFFGVLILNLEILKYGKYSPSCTNVYECSKIDKIIKFKKKKSHTDI